MPKFSPKNRSVFFFLFAVLFFGFSLWRLPAVGAESNEAIVAQYHRDNVSLREAVVRYHVNMNNLFNRSLELMISGRGTVEPPKGENCSDENVSTYCVAERAVAEYEGFFEAMQSHRGYLSDNAVLEQYTTGNQALETYAERDRLVEEQLTIAQKTMDVSLSAYNEVQVFYPLHLEYEELIVALESYRDVLAQVRKEVEKYPGTFHNVTTTGCT